MSATSDHAPTTAVEKRVRFNELPDDHPLTEMPDLLDLDPQLAQVLATLLHRLYREPVRSADDSVAAAPAPAGPAPTATDRIPQA